MSNVVIRLECAVPLTARGFLQCKRRFDSWARGCKLRTRLAKKDKHFAVNITLTNLTEYLHDISLLKSAQPWVFRTIVKDKRALARYVEKLEDIALLLRRIEST